MCGLYLIIGVFTGLLIGLFIMYRFIVQFVEEYAELAYTCLKVLRMIDDEDK